MEKDVFIIEEKDQGTRIDKYLAEVLVDKSRSFIQGLIEKECVKVNGKIPKSNYKLRALDEVEVEISEPEVLNVDAEDIPIDILYEDKED